MKTLIIIIVAAAIVGGGIYLLSNYINNQTENTNEITAVDVVTGTSGIKLKENTDPDLALIKAQEIWRAKVLAGEDLSDGPCLSNEVISGWVADIAHNPRQAVDNLPENQCSAYRDGTAKHFVEIDLEGNLIKAQ